jgi:hypothetical protein
MLSPMDPKRWGFAQAAHLLNRAGFGGPPDAVEELVRLGPEGAVARLVDYGGPEVPSNAPAWARPDPERADRLRRLREGTEEERRAAREEEQRRQRERVQELRRWWLDRMVTTRRPFEEKMVLFWHGHFATSVQKVRDPWLMYRQLETFRQRAVGRWPELLMAVTRDPAMLIWLDQAQSRRGRPNENYAREVMELFALGEGHYTEGDIQEAARALTGLTLDRVSLEPVWRPRLHDDGVKTFLGRSGRLGPEEVIEQIAAQPQADRFIVGKLWRYFAGDGPSAEVEEALAGVFRRGGGEFRPLLRTLFLAEEFYAPSVVRTQVKSPVQWLVCAVRQLERPLPANPAVPGALRELGQDLLAPPNVKGWDGGLAWINTSTLTRRQQLARLLVLGPAGVGERMEGDRGRRPRERAARPGGPGSAGAAGAAVVRLFTAEERGDRARLMSALERRFLQSRFRPALAAQVSEALSDDREPDPRAIVGAVCAVLESTDYQLT